MKSSIASSVLLAGTAYAQAAAYAQCGGTGWLGDTTCVSGYTCTANGEYYSQCLPGAASASASTSATSAASSGSGGSATATATSTGASSSSTGKTKYAGINISGFDFGCSTDGTCVVGESFGPIAANGGADGVAQMQHFYTDDNLNVFRLPVGWQYLVPSPGDDLNATSIASYDILMQGCLDTGALCILDIHNYARWNGEIIGQGGPTNAEFASLWSQLATKYASSNVAFGVMNEPHDVPSITEWATSVQAAVTAIRAAGATSNLILLPGNDYTGAGTFITDGSGPALLNVTNPNGTTDGLIFDVHKYLDSDNSGTSTECVTNNIDNAFSPLATWLRTNGRQAFNTETGGGNTASCEQYLCEEIAYLNANSDVYLGYVGWAAGNFDSTYALDEAPVDNGGTWTDTALVSQCIAR